MGNEQSRLPGINIEDEAKEVSNFWSQHSATIIKSNNVTNLSVFIENSADFSDHALWSTQTPLQKCSKNLMVYRHPCIVKYIGSWHKNSKYYLAVEAVIPLNQVLPTLNNVQISVGLYSILKALLFLHENASTSHNNMCVSSIYVSKDDTWKLGGFEYLCKYADITSKYLELSRASRYNRAIDESESKQLNTGRKDFIDTYAFGVLVNDVLKADKNEEMLYVNNFLDYCKTELQNCDFEKRPDLKTIMDHPFFKQDFVVIYSFLIELPVKNDSEKQEFFQNLVEKLKTFDEKLVARQLSSLLLSRMVLSNVTAQKVLVPCLLTPQTEVLDDQSVQSLFTVQTFKEHISPKLIEIFKVHEVQIRLVLLQYLPKFVNVFTREELQSSILPELLVGIKDTHDELVTSTLRALANLVPILGSDIVIGGNRAKLFNDGRPNRSPSVTISKQTRVQSKSNRSVPEIITLPDIIEANALNVPSERPRPDGEEGTDSQEILLNNEEDLEKWDDWNTIENNGDVIFEDKNDILETHDEFALPSDLSSMKLGSNLTKEITNNSIPDISELDIKNQIRSPVEDIDFFEDMVPVINNSNKFLIDEQNDIILEKAINSKLSLKTSENNEEGWGEDWD